MDGDFGERQTPVRAVDAPEFGNHGNQRDIGTQVSHAKLFEDAQTVIGGVDALNLAGLRIGLAVIATGIAAKLDDA